MKRYEEELGSLITDKMIFKYKHEFNDRLAPPHCIRLGLPPYDIKHLTEYIDSRKDQDSITFMLTEEDSIFHPFVLHEGVQEYMIRARSDPSHMTAMYHGVETTEGIKWEQVYLKINK